MKVGLIGCGAIGSMVAKSIDDEIPELDLAFLVDKERKKAIHLTEQLRRNPGITDSIEHLVKNVDLVVEAASAGVVEKVLRLVMDKQKNAVIMSIGGLLGCLDLLEKIKKEKKCKIFLPSGAIAGLDGLNAAREREIQSVLLTTSKPLQAFENEPYIKKSGIELNEIDKPTIVFEGSCREAVKAFPRNINVSATLSLAGLGVDKTKVRIIADPHLLKNTHRISLRGEFGEMEIEIRNVPSPDNPKTSYLATLSAIATLKKIVASVKIGT